MKGTADGCSLFNLAVFYKVGQLVLVDCCAWAVLPSSTDMLKLNPATQQQRLSSVANTHERYHNQQTAGPNLRQQQALLQNWLTNNNNP